MIASRSLSSLTTPVKGGYKRGNRTNCLPRSLKKRIKLEIICGNNFVHLSTLYYFSHWEFVHFYFIEMVIVAQHLLYNWLFISF